MHASDALRVAVIEPEAWNFGTSASQPSGSSPAIDPLELLRKLGECAAAYASNRSRHSAASSAPRSIARRKCSSASSGT